jgi:very-short-patch-repair endonuclease
VLSHKSAARLWKLLPDTDDRAPVDVSVTRGDPHRGADIRVHRIAFKKGDVTRLGSIPVTSVKRTLLDLASVLAGRELERVLAQAERMNLIQQRDLRALRTRNAGRRGAQLLRTLLGSEGGPALTRSEAEQRFLALVRKGQLPAPETNVRVCGYEVDFFWRRERLVIEVDGFAFHSSARTFESDRRRDSSLAASGIGVVRVTWKQVVNEPEALLVRLAQTLASR